MQPDIQYCLTPDGVRIAYRDGGGDGPPFIWVPGWVSHLELDAQFGRASGIATHRLRFISLDKRGTGLSSRNVEDVSLEARVRDLEALVAHLDLDRFALGGMSEGGPTVIAYAARRPEQITHLVIMGSYADGSRLAGGSELRDAARTVVKLEWGMGSRLMSDLFCGPGSAMDGEQFAKYQQYCANKDDALRVLDVAVSIDVRPLLPSISAPTLVIHHRDDRMVPIEAGQEIAAGIRGARFVSFPGAHIAPPDEIARAFDALVDFVAGEAVRGVADAQAPPAGDPPPMGGLRTILFTDLVGHTEMMRRLGDDRGRDVLREHERITRDVLKQHGGAEVKTMGDGFMASFGSVTRAMDCAIALQRAFASHEGEPLNVRVGLNAGEPIEEDGDLFGSTVILASRIAAKAGAGEILIPEPLRHLLTGKSYVYADRGETMLKGFEDAVRLYEVRWRE